MIHLRADRTQLLAIGLSEKLVDFVLFHPRTGIFNYWCGENNSRWPEDVPWPYAIPSDVTDVYPLWNCDVTQFVMWLRDGKPEFVRLHHDDDEHTFIAHTEQALWADLFITLVEAERPLAELRAGAELVGFRHFEKLWRWMNGMERRLSPDEYDQSRRAFMDEIERSD